MAATAQQILDALNDAILALVTNGAASVTVNGRSYVYQDLDKLREMRTQLAREVNLAAGNNAIRLGDFS